MIMLIKISVALSLTGTISEDISASIVITEASTATTTQYTIASKDITFTSTKKNAAISLTLKANEIEANSNLTIVLKLTANDAAYKLGTSVHTISIAKAAPNTIIVHNVNQTINASNTWVYLNMQTDGDITTYDDDMKPFSIGIFYQTGDLPAGETFRLKLETYEKAVIGTTSGTDALITPLDADDVIGETSNWVTPANAWPDLATISSTGYTDWVGTKKYAGIQVVDFNDDTQNLYVWIELEVSASGDAVTITDLAYDETGAAIKAGQTISE